MSRNYQYPKNYTSLYAFSNILPFLAIPITGASVFMVTRKSLELNRRILLSALCGYIGWGAIILGKYIYYTYVKEPIPKINKN